MPTVPPSKIVKGVKPTGDFLVYLVESRRPGVEAHRVDLQKFCGAGHCTCEDFNIGKKKKHSLLKRGALPSEQLECWHIKQARRYFSFECINRVIEKREKEANANRQKSKETRSVGERVPQPAPAANPPVDRGPGKTVGWRGGATPFAKSAAKAVEFIPKKDVPF